MIQPDTTSASLATEALSQEARGAARPRADVPTFLLHWSLFIAFLISLFMGLRIAADYNESPAGALARGFLSFLPEGQVIELHVLSGWLVTLITIAYAVFIWRSRQTARIKLRQVDLTNITGLRGEGRPHLRAARWFTFHRILTLVAFILILLLTLTGWMMYRGVYFGATAHFVAVVHGISAWLMVGYLALHVITVLKAGTFWKMFRVRSAHLIAGATGILAAATIVVASYFADRAVYTELRVPLVSRAPVLDGEGHDPAWSQVSPVSVHTARGANLPNGEAVVEVRAVHDGDRVYFLFRWPDPTRSQKMLPIIKMIEGWRVLQSGYDQNDVNDYYEDKFAVILSTRPALGSGTIHLGQDLIKGPHYRNPRGLHYTKDSSIVDLWHWKSVRSGGVSPGFIDDNHIGPPLPSETEGVRYTGGYTQDPPGAPHPYVSNWTKVNPELGLDDTPVIPRYLPASPKVLQRIAPVDLDPDAHDQNGWLLTLDEVVPYSEELDDYPIGTVLPGIVLERSYEGDRADVRAEATWQDGFWTLEAARRLDTGSQYDIAFSRARPVYLWVAVFNHTQTRHSYHLQPIRVVLEGI